MEDESAARDTNDACAHGSGGFATPWGLSGVIIASGTLSSLPSACVLCAALVCRAVGSATRVNDGGSSGATSRRTIVADPWYGSSVLHAALVFAMVHAVAAAYVLRQGYYGRRLRFVTSRPSLPDGVGVLLLSASEVIVRVASVGVMVLVAGKLTVAVLLLEWLMRCMSFSFARWPQPRYCSSDSDPGEVQLPRWLSFTPLVALVACGSFQPVVSSPEETEQPATSVQRAWWEFERTADNAAWATDSMRSEGPAVTSAPMASQECHAGGLFGALAGYSTHQRLWAAQVIISLITQVGVTAACFVTSPQLFSWAWFVFSAVCAMAFALLWTGLLLSQAGGPACPHVLLGLAEAVIEGQAANLSDAHGGAHTTSPGGVRVMEQVHALPHATRCAFESRAWMQSGEDWQNPVALPESRVLDEPDGDSVADASVEEPQLLHDSAASPFHGDQHQEHVAASGAVKHALQWMRRHVGGMLWMDEVHPHCPACTAPVYGA
jgi:hypothetical protein